MQKYPQLYEFTRDATLYKSFIRYFAMQPAKTSSVRDKLKVHMKQLNNHDPDIVEVGIKDICQIILKNQIDLKAPENNQLSKQITNEYLKQVGSQNFAVHSIAIRSLAEIVPKVTKEELIHILKSTINSIVDPKTDIKRMQVYCSSASTMINFAPGELGNNLSTLFVECVNQFLRLSSNKNNKQEEELLIHLLNLIIDFAEKWPDVVGNKQLNYDRQLFIQVLLRNVEQSTKLDLIKKSDVALEKLATVFTKQNFEFVFNHKQFGIIPFVRHFQKAKSEEQLKKLKNGISCLDHIVHAHNREMKSWTKQIAKICVELVHEYKNNDEHLYETTEIMESAINCLTSLLKAYASELHEWIGTNKYQYLSSFVQETLNFDLEHLMTYLQTSTEMEDEFEDDMEYFDESSVCWKVREVTLSYIEMLMRKDSEFKDKKGKDPNFLDVLSTKLIEENEGVSKRAFQCFNYIIESISTIKTKQQQADDEPMQIKRVKSNQGNFAFDLVNKIASKIETLFNHKKTKDETKTEASKTLLNLIQLLNQLIKDNQSTCEKVLNLIHDLLPKVKPDSCVFLLKSTKSLINGSLPYNKVQKVIDLYIKMIKNNNFKIVAASFEGLRNIIKCYHDDLLKSGKIDEILNAVLGKLKEHDADKLVKIQSTRCLGPIFKHVLDKLPENIQNDILAAAEGKIKVEIDKTTIFSQIPNISANYSVKKSQQPILKNMLDICSQTIGTANYELSNLSVECCDKLIRLQQNSLNEKTVENILNKCRPILNENRIPRFMDVLLEKFPNSFKPYAESIVKTAEGPYISKIIEKKIITVDACITILKNIACAENLRKLSVILSEINPSKQKLFADINQTKWGLVSLGALGYIGDLATVQQIQKVVFSQQNHDLKFQGARAIGNIVSRHPEYVPKLIEFAKKSNESYLYLQAIKQMLSFRESQFQNLQQVLHFLFEKSEQSDRETNKHLLAESIGHVARFSPKQLRKILQSVNDMNPARRSIVTSSLRYALEGRKKDQIIDESLQEYIDKVIKMTEDKDIAVRQGALKSLNSILDSRYEKIRQQINQEFMESLLDSMTIKAELIKIIDYGVSKEKKDLGKGLRIEAFNFLKGVLNMRQVENYFDSILNKCLEKINEQSSNDLILKRISIIRIICEKDVTAFMPFVNDFATKIGTTEGILKPYSSANLAEDERSEGYLKGLFKQIILITKQVKESSEVLRAMINKLNTFERLNKIMLSVEKSQ